MQGPPLPPTGYGGVPGAGGGGGYGSYGVDRGSMPTLQGRPFHAPAKRKSSGVGVLLGAGCALMLVLVAVGAIGAFVVLRGRGSSEGGRDGSGPQPSAPAVASAKDLRDFVGTRGQVVFVAEIVNSGSSVVTPSARLRLLDTRRAEVTSVPCTTPVRQLGPGEKAPCVFVFTGSKSSFSSSDVVVDARTASGREARLAAFGTTLGRAGFAHQVSGTISNPAAVTVRSPSVLVTLYGADGRIVGGGSLDLKRELGPGATSPFAVTIPEAAAPPKTFAIRAVGLPD